MPISFETYERVALEDDEQWELVCGRLRKKPGMTLEHNVPIRRLNPRLCAQLDPDRFSVSETVHVRVSTGSFYVPDLCVVPLELEQQQQRGSPHLEVYADPLPLIVEVWSPSTGDYDVATKVPEYRQRGDAEIWRIHPYERTLTAWRRQPDGSYSETLHHESAIIEPIALPGVRIELARLFV